MQNLETKASKDELKLVYLDIIKGYTTFKHKELGDIYLKHIDLESSGYIDQSRAKSLERAKSKGLPTKKEKLEYLEKEKLWSKEDEGKLID